LWTPKERVVKYDVEQELETVKGIMEFSLEQLFNDYDKELWKDFEWQTGISEQDVEEIVKKIDNASKTLAYIQQLEQENRVLKEGSDARCTRMLQQALSGSDDADVDFVFDGGQMGVVKGHRGMLCAGSEEYAAMFRSGMVEAQEGKIRVPPGIGTDSFRGFLEWLYLGEFFP
jgi:hypothetical protein